MGKTITQWGKQCKAQMILQGLTLKELSKAVGLSPTYVSAIINGRMIVPQETKEKINKALQVNSASVDSIGHGGEKQNGECYSEDKLQRIL